MAGKIKRSFQRINETRKSISKSLGFWKYVALILMGLTLLVMGISMGNYLALFVGLLVVGLGIMLFPKLVKYLFKIPVVGAKSAEKYIIARFGEDNQQVTSKKTTGKDFLYAFINGDKYKDDKYYHGIRSSFQAKGRNNSDEDKIASQALLEEMYEAFEDKTGEKLYEFFKAEIKKYTEAKRLAQNKDPKTGEQRVGRRALKSLFATDEAAAQGKGYSADDKEAAINNMAVIMADAVRRYLEQSPSRKFAHEDFKLDEEGKNLEEGHEVENYLLDYLEDYAKKDSVSGGRSKIKYFVYGAILGSLATGIIQIVSQFKPDVTEKIADMYKMFGFADGPHPLVSAAIGALIVGMLLVIASVVYTSLEEKVPARLTAESIRQREEVDNTVTPETNPGRT